MLGLTSLEGYKSVFITANENNKFENSKPLEKERRYSLDLKFDDENFLPEDPKDELFRPAVIDKLEQIEFDDINIMMEILHLTEEEIESISISNKLKSQYIMNL